MRMRRPILSVVLAGLVTGAATAAIALAVPASAADDTTPPTTGPSSLSIVNSTTLRASWSPGTDNVGITEYELKFGQQTAGIIQTLSLPFGTTSYTFTNLTPGLCYYSSLRARDAAGNWSTAIATPSLTCLPSGDTTPPSVPGTPSVTAITTTSISLSWAASTDNVGVASYVVYYTGVVSGTTWAITSTTTSATVTGLTPATAYSFQIAARDTAGNLSAKSAATTAGTIVVDTDMTPPTAPGRPVASNLTSTGVTLTWTPSTDNVAVVRYEVWLGIGDVISKAATVNHPTTTANLTGLTPGTTYVAFIRAFDAANNTSSSPSLTFATPGSTPTPTAGPYACAATYKPISNWTGFFQAEVTVRNSGTVALHGWTVRWTFPNGYSITQLWNGTLNSAGPAVSVSNLGWNGALAPGATATFGFQGTTPAGPPATPTITCYAS